MSPTRRTVIAAAALMPFAAVVRAAEPDLSALKPLPIPPPIARAEYARRLVAAQSLMKPHGIGAVLIESGTSLAYFTGVRWGRSERPTVALIPAEGEPCIVTPFFEEPSIRELLAVPATVRVWQEDQSPFAVMASFLRDRRLLSRPVAVEETTRFFIADGLARAIGRPLVSANPVVRACRMIKSAPEIALMQAATDVTVAAYRWTHPRIEAGMTGAEIGVLMTAATRRLGGSPEFALVLVGEGSAYPHGTREVQRVAPGQVVLMDCGCTVRGYQSDVSRTFVFGQASKEQRTVWDHMAQGQQLAFRTAQLGTPAGAVDDAVRKLYAQLGYGPDYRLPGLSHRTGHGIGMDGHEPVNLVRGETTPLAVGMCFSDEPGIYLPGKFGVRLEDCFHMTPQGPRWFSKPPSSIDRPV
ncbi:Xaa-Pro peptidase family protein [Sphingomonas bacterium]|uniref:M24 family metallopeptidase n=1 Tax=Sphingomonas bacterium TaxID=1895847 RepID=UPI0026326AC3|nr:Xaa-Pro peptidase family protein [Sphingomonas bacterium]